MRQIEKPELISTIIDKKKVWYNIRESRLSYMLHRKLISVNKPLNLEPFLKWYELVKRLDLTMKKFSSSFAGRIMVSLKLLTNLV